MPDLPIGEQLAMILQGRKVSLVQRGPTMFVHVFGPLTGDDARALADALAPLVERIADVRAAAELRDLSTHPGLTASVRHMITERAARLDGSLRP